jgi:hypothetical protein
MTNLLILTMLASTTAISSLIRIGCDGGIDVGEKALGGPISARFNGFSKIVDVRVQHTRFALTLTTPVC